MKKVLRPPQAKNEAPVWVAPAAASVLGVAHPLPQVKRAPLTPFRGSCGPVPPAPTTPTRRSGPAGAGLPVSHYASAFIATTKAASRPEKQKSASNAAFLCVCGDAAAHPFRHGSDCSGTSVACEGVAMQSRRVRPLVSMANLPSNA